jgi:hypothetical protein
LDSKASRGTRFALSLIAFRREQIQRLPARRFGRSVRKYLRTNGPSRPSSEPPQDKHVISRSVVGSRGASARTSKYFAAQFGHSNRVEGELGMTKRLIESVEGKPPEKQTRPEGNTLVHLI